jgi:hypothetical protein
MATRSLISGLCMAAAFVLACGPESDVASPPPQEAVSAPELAGAYKVSGKTVEMQGGAERDISGTVILSRRGDTFRSSFELATLLPSPQGALHTEVIGIGEGTMGSDGTVRGSAQTQLVVAAMPGIPTQFPFMPRFVGARILSETVTRFGPDNTVEIEIETRAAPGESYRATRTTLKGVLIPGSKAGPIPR